MSEFTNARKNRAGIRWELLATASAVALIAAAYRAGEAKAADDDSGRSPIWIELGGQLSRLDDGQDAFAPAFPNSPARPSIFSPSQKFERLPLYSVDETGKISFEPTGTDWVLSASVRYGRSSGNKHLRQQTTPKTFFVYYSYYGRRSRITAPPFAGRFADTNAQTGEQHLVLDFQAGKDVGLGMFGENGVSVLGFGVRFAQFSGKSNIALKSDPDWHFSYLYNPARLNFGFTSSKFPKGQIYHSNFANLRAERSFHGIGPSLSWNASAPLMGNPQGSNLSFDWGLNAAVLFGRQRTKIHQQLTGLYHSLGNAPGSRAAIYHPTPANITRSRTVTVPNVGGFAGVSLRIQNFKVSAGYRADLFFGAMDGGIDAAKSENRGFYGPFASISIGF